MRVRDVSGGYLFAGIFFFFATTRMLRCVFGRSKHSKDFRESLGGAFDKVKILLEIKINFRFFYKPIGEFHFGTSCSIPEQS